nr:hypothetical protein [Tanacetum cinerariifolium]
MGENGIGTFTDSMANFANERGEQLIGIANAAEAEVRDNFVANGLRQGETLQPYATNLAHYLERLRIRNGHSQLPEKFLTPGNSAFVKHILHDAVLNYNPQRHSENNSPSPPYNIPLPEVNSSSSPSPSPLPPSSTSPLP